ncbi:hypothetical protein AMS68_002474 [Peltaster fructicola]|uniref:Carboxylesterase type B domain-containing protein n=1 Tax=Peltaster fructicola TaxID=286661 RepID=A0A6H0XQC5_9PEZI|nr:hypothetical protein AMS68_002474 [Peltaster fructicola]
MKFLYRCTIISTLAALSSGQATQPATTVPSGAPIANLGYVSYLGYTNATAGIDYFRGIQYAAAPTGSLRWQKPQPIENRNSFSGQTINATAIAPACYQSQPRSTYMYPAPGTFQYVPQGQSEDCLILDVLRPSSPKSSSLPVMVQIHGGGYTLGNAQSYPGDALVHASNGSVVYVSIQYRLGLLGFLGGSTVADNGVLNAGLLDQRAALDWVQRNIRAFSGDPARVTIVGGSAGGGSVTLQLTAGGAYDTPPFSAAIAEYPWWQPFANASEQESQYFAALRLSNCTTLACLRGLSSSTVATLSQAVENATYPGPDAGYGVYSLGPVVDGKFVRELPDVAFKRGHFYDVPLLVDHDGYEGFIFSNMSQTTQIEETMDAEDLFAYAGPSFFSRLYQLYPRSAYNSTFFQRQTWFGDFIINCPTYFMASRAVDHNSNSSAVYKLTFDAGSELHGATAAFIFSNDINWPGANNNTLAKIMTSYFVSFAVSYDPNPLRVAGAPTFPNYISGGSGNSSNGESVGFSTLAVTYTSISTQHDPDASEKCEFFGNNGYVVMN